MLKNPAQQGRSERKAEAYPLGYVEALSDARTPLEGFCNILKLREGEPRLIGLLRESRRRRAVSDGHDAHKTQRD